MIAFRFAGPQTVEHKPEAPAPKFDVRNCFPGHFDTLQFASILTKRNFFLQTYGQSELNRDPRCYKDSSKLIKNKKENY
jgi:hypothetical protein